jgi:hypothetical protein
VGPIGRANSSDTTALLPPLWPYPSTDMPGTASLTGPTDMDVPYEQNGNWVYQGQQQLFGQDSINVDDLLYGFNGSALDSFPILDWDTM